MSSWTHLWRRWASARQSWGLAPLGQAWVLVGLTRQNQNLAKVQTMAVLLAPEGPAPNDLTWLSQDLRLKVRTSMAARRRLNMALQMDQLQEGYIDFPVAVAKSEWLYEVQLEVSLALQLRPEEVSFDFAAEALSNGLVQRVHWMGCAKARMEALKNCTRAAGCRLATVESETQAASRAVRALQGGVASLLTLAPQDWQFRWGSAGADVANLHPQALAPSVSDAQVQEAIESFMPTPSGARLVASGLALGAWT